MYITTSKKVSGREHNKVIIVKSLFKQLPFNFIHNVLKTKMDRSRLTFEDDVFTTNDLTGPDDLYVTLFREPETSKVSCMSRQIPYDRYDPDLATSGYWGRIVGKLGYAVTIAQTEHRCESIDQCMLPYLKPVDILNANVKLAKRLFPKLPIILGNCGGLDVAMTLDKTADCNLISRGLAQYLEQIGFEKRTRPKSAGNQVCEGAEMLLPVLLGPSITLQKFRVKEKMIGLLMLGSAFCQMTKVQNQEWHRCVQIQSTTCPQTKGTIPWLTIKEMECQERKFKQQRMIPRFITHVVGNAIGKHNVPPKSTIWLKVCIPGYEGTCTAYVTPNPFYLKQKGLVIPDSVTRVVQGGCFIQVANTLDETIHTNPMDILVTLQMVQDGDEDDQADLCALGRTTVKTNGETRLLNTLIGSEIMAPEHCVPPNDLQPDEEYEKRDSTPENIEKMNKDIPLFAPEDFGLHKRDDLSNDQKNRIMQVVNKYRHIFTSEQIKLGRIKIVKHSIETTTSRPIRQRPYVVAQAIRPDIDRQIAEMLKSGVIKVSNSPWASPMVVVKKKDGTFRICIDFRKVNDVTVKDVFPLPRIQEVVDRLSGCNWISTFDMASGYWQIAMDERDQQKTAFICHAGLFEWTVMPFGLTNAPATFQRLTEAIFAGVAFRQPYFDDVMIFSKNFDDHMLHLGDTFLQCHLTGAVFKTGKSEVAQKEVHLLGFIAGTNGVKTDPAKIALVQQFPQPRTPKNIKQFLGLCGYYRQFVPDFSTTTEPLTALLKKDTPFKWTSTCAESFEKLKGQLANSGVLVYPKTDRPFTLVTNASAVGVSAILEQPYGGSMKPIMHISRTLNPHERNYTTMDLECLAVIWALSKLRAYLFGHQFEIVTDHNALQWLLTTGSPSGRTGRWVLQLQEFDFKIRHRPGAGDILAKALMAPLAGGGEDGIEQKPLQEVFDPVMLEMLKDVTVMARRRWGYPSKVTREPVNHWERARLMNQIESELVTDDEEEMETQDDTQHQDHLKPRDDVEHTQSTDGEKTEMVAAVAQEVSEMTKVAFKRQQRMDPFCQAMIQYLELNKIPLNKSLETLIPRIAHDFSISDSLLTHTYVPPRGRQSQIRKRLVVPNEFVTTILREAHSLPTGGHQGFLKTYDSVSRNYFWLAMNRDIVKYIADCRICNQRNKGANMLPVKLKPIPAVDGPFDRLGIDFVGPLPPTKEGYKYILVFTDYLTRWPEAFPTLDNKAQTATNVFIEQIFCRYGAPREILTDRGTHFTGDPFAGLMKLLGIHHKMTTAYHPQTNGLTERFNGTICRMMAKYIARKDHKDWSRHINRVLGAYRFAIQRSIGFSPFQLLMGFEPRMPTEIVLKDRVRGYESAKTYFHQFTKKLTKLRQDAKMMLEDAQVHQKQYHDSSGTLRTRFEVNQKVWLKRPKNLAVTVGVKKFTAKGMGPYRITEICHTTDTVRIVPDGPNVRVVEPRVSVSRLRAAGNNLHD